MSAKKSSPRQDTRSAAALIDQRIEELGGWRGQTLTKIRAVKMTFAKGASLEHPAGLFNSSLTGSTRRAIDFREDATIDEKALKALIRAAVKLNTSRSDE